jgi:hypothetical protein
MNSKNMPLTKASYHYLAVKAANFAGPLSFPWTDYAYQVSPPSTYFGISVNVISRIEIGGLLRGRHPPGFVYSWVAYANVQKCKDWF